MTDAEGNQQTDRQSIANVLADFYEELYSSKCSSNDICPAQDVKISPFNRCDLEKAMKQMKSGRARDSSGIISEMLQSGGDVLWDMLLSLYNAVISPSSPTPTGWKKTVMTVLHKSGDTGQAKNYRPIALYIIRPIVIK